MTKVYTIFSLLTEDVPRDFDKMYFYPNLNGTSDFMGNISNFTPILFVKKD